MRKTFSVAFSWILIASKCWTWRIPLGSMRNDTCVEVLQGPRTAFRKLVWYLSSISCEQRKADSLLTEINNLLSQRFCFYPPNCSLKSIWTSPTIPLEIIENFGSSGLILTFVDIPITSQCSNACRNVPLSRTNRGTFLVRSNPRSRADSASKVWIWISKKTSF